MSENATPSPTPSPTPADTSEGAPLTEQDAPTVQAPAAPDQQPSGGQVTAAESASESAGPFYAQI